MLSEIFSWLADPKKTLLGLLMMRFRFMPFLQSKEITLYGPGIYSRLLYDKTVRQVHDICTKVTASHLITVISNFRCLDPPIR
jgi:hypothetical protein